MGMSDTAEGEQDLAEGEPRVACPQRALPAQRATASAQAGAPSRRVRRPFAPGFALRQRWLEHDDVLPFRVRGGSMLPTLWPGDVVTVAPIAAGELAPGDVVVYARDGGYVVHRVVERAPGAGGTAWITRGDARREVDAPTPAGDVLGVVTRIRRLGRERPMPRARLPQVPGLGRFLGVAALAVGGLRRVRRGAKAALDLLPGNVHSPLRGASRLIGQLGPAFMRCGARPNEFLPQGSQA